MKIISLGSVLPVFFIISCNQAPAVDAADPKMDLVSTFDIALDRETQTNLEAQFDAVLNPQNLDDWMKHMSSKPHHVGSPWSKQNAEFIAKKFESWGFETEIETFDVLMPFPKIRKLEMVGPNKVPLQLKEPALDEDATSGITKDLLPGFNAFSADGDVTAELVYVNYGIPADYEELERLGIEVEGKIILARYGGSWRGIKPKVAREKGAIGCILYSDPKDDGYFQGDVYPKGPYRMEHPLRRAYNPVAKLKGSVYPDEWIMRGNHHDGWAQGAADPISGMVSLMEEARAISELVKTGWKPKRTLAYAGWDAEEPGLLGSTEWVEYHLDEIQEKMVVYINTDGTGVGFMGVGGSHSLEKFVNEVASEVIDPVQDVTLKKRIRSRLRISGNKDAERDDLRIYPLGSGSDYTAFIHHAGVPALNIGFGGESGGGSYHSMFDSYDHYKRFSDGDYIYGTTLAKVNGRMVLRLSEADILPFRFMNMAENIGTFIESNKKLAKTVAEKTKRRNRLLNEKAFTISANPKKTFLPPKRLDDVPEFDFTPLEAAHQRLKTSAMNYEKALSSMKKGSMSAEMKIQVNRLLKDVEQSMTRKEGLPRRNWFRNMIYAPGYYTGYGVKTLPGIREGLEERKWDETHLFIGEVTKALDRASAKINAATEILKAG